MEIELVALVVDDYDEAIAFFVDDVGFELVEDSPAATNDGRSKRWVVVRPPGATTGILLARADGDEQRSVVGRQHAGRVGFFLRVDDFGAAYRRMTEAGVRFVSEPRDEPYGRVAVWLDVAGNRWDLLGPVDAVDVVLAFNEAINRRDLAALTALMTASHRFVDSAGAVVDGRDASVDAWRSFFDGFPDYRNEFDEITDSGGGVVDVRGRSSCSFAPLDGPAEWRAVVVGGRVDVWQVSEAPADPTDWVSRSR